MCAEINLLKNYPNSKRNLEERSLGTDEQTRSIAREFGKDFFDGERKFGYGGFSYNKRFWQPVVPDLINHWNLNSSSSLLDVGCAKGFFLHDLSIMIPGIKVKGIDISQYAIDNTIETMTDYCQYGNAYNLEFQDNSFDIVFSINTVHNLEIEECKVAIKEIERVSKKGSFITVDAYETEDEKERMFKWNLTAKTILSKKDWINVFNECGYTGDYHWFIP